MHDDLILLVVHSLSSVTGPGAMPLQVSTETYGRAAEVEVTGDIHCLMPYIPSHLDYMLYELLKNAHRCKCVCGVAADHSTCVVFPQESVTRCCQGQPHKQQTLSCCSQQPGFFSAQAGNLLCRAISAQLLRHGRPAVLLPLRLIEPEQRCGCSAAGQWQSTSPVTRPFPSSSCASVRQIMR